MPGAAEALASLLALATVPTLTLALVVRGLTRAGSPRLTRRRHRPEPSVDVRPIEEVARDVRRIAERYHQDGMRFAQYEGRRQAYDRVLAEAADMLDLTHLLGVLPPGPELDRERGRVERLLRDAGVLPHTV
ncbi:MAG TPA: hypothetical protein VD814_03630 [Nocardioides sp.]|nr:hypothetical protein [Nocardioides sp.]